MDAPTLSQLVYPA